MSPIEHIPDVLDRRYKNMITGSTTLEEMCVGILLPCGKHLDDRISSVRGEVLAQLTRLTPPLGIHVIVPTFLLN